MSSYRRHGSRRWHLRIFGGGGDVTDPEAATELAKRLQRIVEGGKPLNMSDVDNDVDRMSTGARAVVEGTHPDIAEDMKQAVKDLRRPLEVTDIDPFTSLS